MVHTHKNLSLVIFGGRYESNDSKTGKLSETTKYLCNISCTNSISV